MENGDQELFQNFLSGRDSAWAAVVATLVARRSLYDRSDFGLTRLAPGSGGSPIEINLMPDLKSAELAWDEYYAFEVGNSLTETIRLRQTGIFRLGPGRWLLAPPDPSFWGETVRVQGQRLAMSFPARDGDVGRRLALDMDKKLVEMCNTQPEMNCQSGRLLELQLSTDPADLVGMAAEENSARSRLNAKLPTPSLVGMPTDEVSYQALSRGYAALVTGNVARRLLDLECCDRQVARDALLGQMLAELSLRPNLPALSVYKELHNSAVGLADVHQIWTRDGDNRTEAGDRETMQAFVQFMAERTGMKVARALRSLEGEPSFWEWLQRSSPGIDAGFTVWERHWRSFVAQKAEYRLRAGMPETPYYAAGAAYQADGG